MDEFYQRASLDNDFMNHLNKIIHPLGITQENYINIRYIAQTNLSYNDWLTSFNYVWLWLDQNQKSII